MTPITETSSRMADIRSRPETTSISDDKLSLHEKKLHKVCIEGDSKALEKLLQKKSTPNVSRSGVSALIAATKANNHECVGILLKNGAIFTAQDPDGYTSLILAVTLRHTESELAISNHLKRIASKTGVDPQEKSAAKEALAEAAKLRLKMKDEDLKNKGGAALQSKLAIKAERDATRKLEAAKSALIVAQEGGDETVIASAQRNLEVAEQVFAAASETMKAAMAGAQDAKEKAKLEKEEAAKLIEEEKIREHTRLKLEAEAKQQAAKVAEAARAGAVAASEAESERAREVAAQEHAASVAKAKAKLHFEAKRKKRSGDKVVEAPAEFLVGKGNVLGRELWEKRYVVFFTQTHRLEVIDAFTDPDPSYELSAVANVLSGTAVYKVQGLRGRRHRIEVEAIGTASTDDDNTAAAPPGASEASETTQTYARGDVISIVFDSKEVASKMEEAINSAQRAKEERARQDTAARAKKTEGLFWEKKERQEQVAMRKEELRSRDAEIAYEELLLIAQQVAAERVIRDMEEKAIADALAAQKEIEQAEKAAKKEVKSEELKAKKESEHSEKILKEHEKKQKQQELLDEKERQEEAEAEAELLKMREQERLEEAEAEAELRQIAEDERKEAEAVSRRQLAEKKAELEVKRAEEEAAILEEEKKLETEGTNEIEIDLELELEQQQSSQRKEEEVEEEEEEEEEEDEPRVSITLAVESVEVVEEEDDKEEEVDVTTSSDPVEKSANIIVKEEHQISPTTAPAPAACCVLM